ncbi:MAG: UDP-forming cellulose synthase catalytic subunit [Pseudomonadota bacterium]
MAAAKGASTTHKGTSHQRNIRYYRSASITAGMLVLAFFSSALLALIPTEFIVQLQLSVISIALILFLAWVQPQGILRGFLLTLILFTSTRYILWRATSTLPTDDPVSLFFGVLLLIAEFHGYLLLALGLFINANQQPRRPVGAPVKPERLPTVDVLIPSYNESIEILEKTLVAALAIRYPADRLRVYLCDDGGTDQRRHDSDPEKREEALARHKALRALCRELGAYYLTRAENKNAKAGNLNEALKLTTGDLVLVLDADHVPTRDILERTVGYFSRDSRLFMVQTPHFFINPDPMERNLGTFKVMPNENEMFYSAIQNGLDVWQASFFCGSAAVLRREHLRLIGGISGQTITEDAETALTLHSLGLHSAYVPRPMIAGLAPETLSGFITQRMRWAQGMVQLFLLKNPMRIEGLSLGQRLCYLNSIAFWFFPFARILFILSPILYLFFGISVFQTTAAEFLAYSGPHVLSSILLAVIFYGRFRWFLVSEIYELMQCAHSTIAVLKVLANPLSPSFVVTPKGEQLDRDFISPVATPFYVLYGIVVLAQIFGIADYFFSADARPLTAILLFWNTFHLVLMTVVMGILYENRQLRTWPRLAREEAVTLQHQGLPADNDKMQLRPVFGHTINMSASGAEIIMDELSALTLGDGDSLPPVGTRMMLDAYEHGSREVAPFTVEIREARQAQDGQVKFRVEFTPNGRAERQSAVLLFYGRSEPWIAFREGRATPGRNVQKFLFVLKRGVGRALAHFVALFLGPNRRSSAS